MSTQAQHRLQTEDE